MDSSKNRRLHARFRFAAGAAFLAVTALAVTACSSGGSSSDGGTTAAADSSTVADIPTPAKDDALNAALLATGNNGTLVTATDLTVGQPWATQDGTTPVGMDIDLANAIGAVLGAKIDLQNTSFDSLIPGLVAGRYDLTVSAMIDNSKRQAQVDFVDFITDASGFAVQKGSDLTDLSLDTACGHTIGVIRGGVEEGYLTEQQAKCGDNKIDIQVFQQLQQAVLAVASGRIEALLGDKLQNGYLAAQPDAKVVESGGPVGEAPVGMALPKDSKLVPVVQQALQKLIDDGTYGKILDKYGASGGALTTATVNANVS
jgi:polar amino acid transport system substrate-binding protein